MNKLLEAIFYALWSVDGEDIQFEFYHVICELV